MIDRPSYNHKLLLLPLPCFHFELLAAFERFSKHLTALQAVSQSKERKREGAFTHPDIAYIGGVEKHLVWLDSK